MYLKSPGVDRDHTLKNFIVYGVETVTILFPTESCSMTGGLRSNSANKFLDVFKAFCDWGWNSNGGLLWSHPHVSNLYDVKRKFSACL